jgi:hypothetical protein
MVIVLTCPRDGASYLAQTLQGIGDEVVVLNDDECRGSRWNTWRALKLASEKARDGRLILLQDDIELQSGALQAMQTVEIPADVGVVNFHDFGDDFMPWDRPSPGFHKFPAHRFGSGGMCGAQALVISRDHCRWLADQELPPEYPHQDTPHGADYAIGWLTARSLRPWKLVVRPSPVIHLGAVSACHVRTGSQPQAPTEAYAP